MNIMIRFARNTDLMQISEIHIINQKKAYRGIFDELYLKGLTVEDAYTEWTKYYRKADRRILVYEIEGEIVGFAGVKFFEGKKDCGLLDYLHTKEEYRNRGIGTELLRAACLMLLSEEIHNMEIFCVEGNNNAKKFYENMGAIFNGFKIRTYTSVETISNRFIIKDIGRVCPANEQGEYSLNNDYNLLVQYVKGEYILFGAGEYAEKFFEQFGEVNRPQLIFDNNVRLHKLRINGVEIAAPRLTSYNVIVTCPYTMDIEEQLHELGYQKIAFFCPWHQYI